RVLVLFNSGYFAVPVLDGSYKLAGSISKTVILDQILGIDRYEVERPGELKVHEVMNTEINRIHKEASFIDGLKSVINAPYVCVVDGDGYLDGILTRRAIWTEIARDYYRHYMQLINRSITNHSYGSYHLIGARYIQNVKTESSADYCLLYMK